VKAISKQILSAIERAMQVRDCAVFIKSAGQEGTIDYRRMTVHQWHQSLTASVGFKAILAYLTSHPQPAFRKTLSRSSQTKKTGDALSWMVEESAVIAFPLFFRDHINGILIMGEKRSGEDYTREDVDLLETLCSQSALAIENARSYEHIETLNNQLEKKVSDRTRALKKVLQEKERTQEQLIRSESLAAIGQLVAGVAHELNNPLAGAISLTQTAVEDLEELKGGRAGLDSATIEDLQFAEKELVKARNIVRSLLDLSRQTDVYSEKVDMNAVVKDANHVLCNQYKHLNIPITKEYSENLPFVQGNFAALGQVVVNIIKNAIQAIENRKGDIILSMHHDAHENQVVFQCSDSGPGIPDNLKKDIFKPFFTTKEVGKGTGLGLYICHEIVKKHHGQLVFTTREGKGTLFTVRLPAVA
jgi:signal transduction histidine kinase